jgi:hypothetical protein
VKWKRLSCRIHLNEDATGKPKGLACLEHNKEQSAGEGELVL